jgi:type IV pilus assembly protein PilC
MNVKQATTRKLGNEFLSVLCGELAMLTQAGVPLSDGLLLLMDDHEEKDVKAVLKDLFEPLEQNMPLSAALLAAGGFPAYLSGMVKAGEDTGQLAESLTELSEYYERMERLRVALKNAVAYPSLLLVMLVGVVVVLITRVLPLFSDALARLGARMSPLALRLLQFGRWLTGASTVIACVVGAVLLVAAALWFLPKARAGIVKAFNARWGTKGLLGEVGASRFASVMSLALKSGLGIEEAVVLAGELEGGGENLSSRGETFIGLLREGKPMSDALCGAGLLTAREGKMLALGMRSGLTASAMADIARRKDIDVRDRIDRAVGRVEPVMVIVASLVVGMVLLSVMLPLMGIMSTIG